MRTPACTRKNAAFLSCTCFSVSFVIGFPSDLNVFKAIQLVHQFWLQALEVFWVNSRSLKPVQWSWHPVWLTLLFAMLLRAATRGNFVMMSVWTPLGPLGSLRVKVLWLTLHQECVALTEAPMICKKWKLFDFSSDGLILQRTNTFPGDTRDLMLVRPNIQGLWYK